MVKTQHCLSKSVSATTLQSVTSTLQSWDYETDRTSTTEKNMKCIPKHAGEAKHDLTLPPLKQQSPVGRNLVHPDIGSAKYTSGKFLVRPLLDLIVMLLSDFYRTDVQNSCRA